MLAQSMIVFATAVALIAGLSADASALLPLRVREKEQRQSLMNRARGPQAQKRSCNHEASFSVDLSGGLPRRLYPRLCTWRGCACIWSGRAMLPKAWWDCARQAMRSPTLYMKVASTARRIFDPQGKKTFATISATSGHAPFRPVAWLM
jgi:hypothetical protein